MKIEFHYYITLLNITPNSKNASIVLAAAGLIHKA
jgi:hypothetical protein